MKEKRTVNGGSDEIFRYDSSSKLHGKQKGNRITDFGNGK